MADYEETKQMETGSGIYRKLSPRVVGVLSVVLWAILSTFGWSMYNDVRDNSKAITTLVAQREADRNEFIDFKSAIKDALKELQSDMKEILREMRK